MNRKWRNLSRVNGSNTHTYDCWKAMRQRCYKESDKSYHRYGGQGITICQEWRNDYDAFHDWAMACDDYAPGLTVDRKDPDGPYEPSNCRWLTRSENASRGRITEKRREASRANVKLAAKACSKQVRRLDPGEIYESTRSAARAIGGHNQHIAAVCRGKIKTHKGIKFEYVN